MPKSVYGKEAKAETADEQRKTLRRVVSDLLYTVNGIKGESELDDEHGFDPSVIEKHLKLLDTDVALVRSAVAALQRKR